MASALNVIALISGGKDSLFSILHCQANGHTVVALANLHPATQSTNDDEDINSYMYQTVGHSVIPLYEEALGIPLYRQEIKGSAVNSSRDYEDSKGQEQERDETEDLIPLLEKILKAHPEANAISTGAILSTYQRTRVESVALRLGLVPLSYLWQYPLLRPYTQSSLLHDMAAVGQEAVIIKTASGGLDEGFLGLNVAHQRTIARLGKAMARFGEATNGAIVGEGGEFETLALGGPGPLWKKRIRLDETSTETIDGGQTVMKVRRSTLVEDHEGRENGAGVLRIPEVFDEEFKAVLEVQDHNSGSDFAMTDTAPSLNGHAELHDATSESRLRMESLPGNLCSESSSVFAYSNLVGDTQTRTNESPSRQLTKILLRLEHVLAQRHLSRTSINHCTLLLRNMTDFTILNPVYGTYFSAVNPPARVTIAVGDNMPRGVDVMLSIILDKTSSSQIEQESKVQHRQGLHVQGRSYWAPANIGPYSQAISVPLPQTQNPKDQNEEKPPCEIVYVAGQIPLAPSSMEVYTTQGFKGQAVLSLQHLWRIGRAKNVKWWTAAVAFIPDCEPQQAQENAQIAQKVWKAIHSPPLPSRSSQEEGADGAEEEDDDEANHIDPWDRLNRHSDTTSFVDNTYRSPIPDFTALSTSSPSPSSSSSSPTPPCIVAQVSSLPRDVAIEWSASGLTSSSIHISQISETPRVTETAPRDSASRFYTFEIGDEAAMADLSKRSGVEKWTSATVYAGPGFGVGGLGMMGWEGVQWVPCVRVWGEGGREVRGVVVGRVDGEV